MITLGRNSSLTVSKTNFERVIREKAPSTININERAEIDLPNTLQEAINVAKLNNADLLIAKLDYQIAEKGLQRHMKYIDRINCLLAIG